MSLKQMSLVQIFENNNLYSQCLKNECLKNKCLKNKCLKHKCLTNTFDESKNLLMGSRINQN